MVQINLDNDTIMFHERPPTKWTKQKQKRTEDALADILPSSELSAFTAGTPSQLARYVYALILLLTILIIITLLPLPSLPPAGLQLLKDPYAVACDTAWPVHPLAALAALPQDWYWGGGQAFALSSALSPPAAHRPRAITSAASAFQATSAATTWQGHPDLCAPAAAAVDESAVVDDECGGQLDLTRAEREAGVRWLVLRLLASVVPQANCVHVDAGATRVYNAAALVFAATGEGGL